jgi:glycine reductase
MRQDIDAMAALANKIMAGEEILWADAEGYFPRGIRKEVFVEKTAADRVVDMLLAKLADEPYETEYKIEERDNVVPSKPIADMAKANIALITSGSLVPVGNPDRMPTGTASIWKRYDISKLDAFKAGEFYSVHAGINTNGINDNPEILVPLAPLRELEKEGEVGAIHPYLYATTGNLTFLKDAQRMGGEIAEVLKSEHVDGAIFVST